MARFNFLARKRKMTQNLAGGQAFGQSPELRLASLVLTSFATEQFYRSEKQTFADLKALLDRVSPAFAAKAALYARTVFGMRSISHVLAAELAAKASGAPWAKGFYQNIVVRPDDMTEILSVLLASDSGKLPNAVRKGFARAFDKFDGYQLAKYRSEGKQVKLVDVVNLVRPVPVGHNAEALRQLVQGTLRNEATWEAKLTNAGQAANSESSKEELKAEAWAELVRSRRIGYFALLRNLRNIAEQAPELVPDVCDMLTNSRLVEKSLVLPFRFTAALDALRAARLETGIERPLLKALHQAVDLALANVPRLEGDTLIVLDDSGSMMGKPIQIGALFAAVLYRTNNADLMRFSDDASYVRLDPNLPTLAIAKHLEENARAAGTDFNAIFQKANRRYDRILVLSDMQGWMGGGAPVKAFADYKARHKVAPYVFSFDLQGYGSLQFPQEKVFALAGFSEKVFDLMALLERDPAALVHEIEKMELN